jgi:G3E family GTPase
MSTRKPIPVVLVGGFLGAGKTTLMRRLIVDAHARRLKIAVIVNEFGAVDVDSNILRELEREAAGEILTGIAGGCACCSGQDDLHWTLLEIGQRQDETRPAVILIEASGVADPVLLLDVLTAAQLIPLLRPAAVVAVVDAERLLALPPEAAPLMRRQMQLADTLVLNKTDLVTPDALQKVRDELLQSNPQTRLVSAVQCEFDLAPLWQRALGSGRDAPVAGRDMRVLAGGVNAEAENGSAHDATPQHSEAAPHTHFQTVFCPLPHPVERALLEAALQELPVQVWRAKGFVQLRGEGLFLLQYTGGESRGRYQLAPFLLPPSTQEPETSLVFIGAALDREAIMKSFRGALLSMLF